MLEIFCLTPPLTAHRAMLYRLWFVRMPKPLEESGSTASEHEMESYRTQVAILNESLNVKRVRSPLLPA